MYLARDESNQQKKIYENKQTHKWNWKATKLANINILYKVNIIEKSRKGAKERENKWFLFRSNYNVLLLGQRWTNSLNQLKILRSFFRSAALIFVTFIRNVFWKMMLGTRITYCAVAIALWFTWLNRWIFRLCSMFKCF